MHSRSFNETLIYSGINIEENDLSDTFKENLALKLSNYNYYE